MSNLHPVWFAVGGLVLYCGVLLLSRNTRTGLRRMTSVPDHWSGGRAFLAISGGYILYAVALASLLGLLFVVMWFLEYWIWL
jgi:hypothetical protein